MTLQRKLSDTLVPALTAEDQFFLRRIARDYALSVQEIRHLARAARDLEMWRETSLACLWEEAEAELPTGDLQHIKQDLLQRVDARMDRLRSCEKAYPTEPLRGLTHAKAKLVKRTAPTTVFGLCPFFSKEANCCGLYTIDAASGCALGCSYCPVSAYLGHTVEFSTDLEERLALVELNPRRFYHVTTGQFSDSLVWGNRHGILKALLSFARRNPNIMLELKTKSDRIDYLLKQDLPHNVVCSWIIDTDTIIRNEEHGTATLGRRLQAARSMADRGCRIGLHVHPLVSYSGWRAEYASLAGRLMAQFSPDELDFLSMGVMSFTPPVIREIRRRGGESKALQMPLVNDPPGRLTYPAAQRVELYSTFYRALQPWHGRIFFYLCMETKAVWEAVLGEVVSIRGELARISASRLGPGAGSSRSLTSAA